MHNASIVSSHPHPGHSLSPRLGYLALAVLGVFLVVEHSAGLAAVLLIAAGLVLSFAYRIDSTGRRAGLARPHVDGGTLCRDEPAAPGDAGRKTVVDGGLERNRSWSWR